MGFDWSDVGAEAFNNLSILKKVAPEAVQGILGSCEMRSLEQGDVLINEACSASELFFVLEGRLEVELADPEMEVIYIDVGQTVGELSVIDKRPASATVKASYYTRVLVVTEDKFWRLIDVSHQFAKNLLVLLSQRMRTDNALLKESLIMKNMFEEQTTQDPLTSLHNRRWIDLQLPKIIRRARFGKEPISAMMIDIDHFKLVNDTFGHLKGDMVLRFVAKCIQESIRPHDFACRFGGEEFLIIFPNTCAENASIAAERIRRTIEKNSLLEQDLLGIPAVTITGGVSSLETLEGCTVESLGEKLINDADMKLYDGKESGRNRVIC